MENPKQGLRNIIALQDYIDVVNERLRLEIECEERDYWDAAGLAVDDDQEISMVLTSTSKPTTFHEKKLTPLDIPGLIKVNKERIRYLKQKHGQKTEDIPGN